MNIPRYLVFGENIEDKLQFISSMKHCSKLYDMYLNEMSVPFIEYGFIATINNTPCQAIFILCPDIIYTDELMKNDYFKNVFGYIICCSYDQTILKLQQYNQLISKYSVFTYHNMYIWFISKKEDETLLSINYLDSFVFNDNSYIDKIINDINQYYSNLFNKNNDESMCIIL